MPVHEVVRLLAVADRNLADTVALAATALAAEGYRAGRDRHHERLLDSLRHTIDLDSRLLKQMHDVRRARNTMAYEQVGTITVGEAEAIIKRVSGIREAVVEWLRAQHGELSSE